MSPLWVQGKENRDRNLAGKYNTEFSCLLNLSSFFHSFCLSLSLSLFLSLLLCPSLFFFFLWKQSSIVGGKKSNSDRWNIVGAPFWKNSKQSTIQGQVLSVIYKDTFLQSGRLYSKRVNKSSVKSLTVHCDEDRRQRQNEVIMLKIDRGKGLYIALFHNKRIRQDGGW